MYSISKIAKMCGLSRTSLIYYDSIGILTPQRTESGYRTYSEDDLDRLQKICVYRNTGMSLDEIKEVLSQESSSTQELLEKRLRELNREIAILREQQQLILDILGSEHLVKETRVLSKEQWISILRRSGLDDEGMLNWHKQFEQCAPEAHQDFLESIGFSHNDALKVREKFDGKEE